MLRGSLGILLVILVATASYADPRAEAKAQVAFGIAAAQHGLWREATYRFERAVAIDASYAFAYNNLAVACEQQGLIEKARDAYEKALALAPDSELIRQNYELFKETHARSTGGVSR
ncbi:MAG: tetratricopeptide repeat protein [Cyanobacteria bacterium]|nr:tetratricopeptide repeat protein [Cyanobacteriota bacterium]